VVSTASVWARADSTLLTACLRLGLGATAVVDLLGDAEIELSFRKARKLGRTACGNSSPLLASLPGEIHRRTPAR